MVVWYTVVLCLRLGRMVMTTRVKYVFNFKSVSVASSNVHCHVVYTYGFNGITLCTCVSGIQWSPYSSPVLQVYFVAIGLSFT